MRRALAATSNGICCMIFELVVNDWSVLDLPLNDLLYRTALVRVHRVHSRVWKVGELRGILRNPESVAKAT